MPNPSQDDDIIELTEIVEQGTVALSEEDEVDFLDQPGEEHFEKEMGDLFTGSDSDDAGDAGEADDEPLLLDDALEPLSEFDEIDTIDEIDLLDDVEGGDDTVLDSAFSDFISVDDPSRDDLNASLNQSFGLPDEMGEFAEAQTEAEDMEAEDFLDPLQADAFDRKFGLGDESAEGLSGEDLTGDVEDAEDVLDGETGLELFDPEDPDEAQVLDDMELFDDEDLEPTEALADVEAPDELGEPFDGFEAEDEAPEQDPEQAPEQDQEAEKDMGPAWSNGLEDTDGLDDLDDLDSLLAEVTDSTVPLASEEDDLESPAEAVDGARQAPFVKALDKLSKEGKGLDPLELDLSPDEVLTDEDLEDDTDIFEDLNATPKADYVEPEPVQEQEDVFSDLDNLMDGLSISPSQEEGAAPAEEAASAEQAAVVADAPEELSEDLPEDMLEEMFEETPEEQDLSPLLEISEDRGDTVDDEEALEILDLLPEEDEVSEIVEEAPVVEAVEEAEAAEEVEVAEAAEAVEALEADEIAESPESVESVEDADEFAEIVEDAEEIEAAELLEPWNEESEEDLLEDLTQANQAAQAQTAEESPPDLNDLLASMEDEAEPAPATPAPAVDMQVAQDVARLAEQEAALQASLADFQGEMDRRVETLESRLAAWRMDEIYRRLDSLEQGMAETRPEALNLRVNNSVAEALESAPEDSPLIQRLARTIVEGLEARLSEMLDARLKDIMPAEDLLTQENMQELSESLKAELSRDLEQLAVKSAAKAIREELAGILTEAADEE